MDHVDPKDIRHLVVLGHPAEQSFNRSVAEAYCHTVEECGQTAILRDLYAMGFDPLLKADERPGLPGFAPSPDVRQELDLIRDCAVITLIYPLWFGMPPAIIKGYLDRVLGAGVLASELKEGSPHHFLHGKRLAIFSSSGSTRPWLEEKGQWRSLRQAFELYLGEIFSLKGDDHLHFDAIVSNSPEQYIHENLEMLHERARTICATVLSERHARQMRLLCGERALA